MQVEGTYFRPENGIRLGAAAECNDTTPVWSSTAPSSAGFATTVYNRTGAQVFFVEEHRRRAPYDYPNFSLGSADLVAQVGNWTVCWGFNPRADGLFLHRVGRLEIQGPTGGGFACTYVFSILFSNFWLLVL